MTLGRASEEILQLLSQRKTGEAEIGLAALERAMGRAHPEYLYVKLVLRAHQTRYQEASEAGQMLMSTHSSDPSVRFYYARACLALGRWEEGLHFLDSARPARFFGGPPITTEKSLWSGEDLNGKTFLLVCEGGMGDAICFSRFVRNFQMRGAKVVLASYAPLFELLDGVAGPAVQVDREICTRIHFDYWLPALSSPRALGLNFGEINGAPYIQCPQKAAEKWAPLMNSNRPKVGICWQGNPSFIEDNVRSIPNHLFAPLLNSEDFSFFKISFHEENNSLAHPNLIDLGAHVYSPNDSAGFLSQLDLFITVDSGLAHLAAAMGVRTILMNRVMGWFTFTVSPDHEHAQLTPWYDSMLILHQKEWGEWGETVSRLDAALKAWRFSLNTLGRPEAHAAATIPFRNILGDQNGAQ